MSGAINRCSLRTPVRWQPPPPAYTFTPELLAGLSAMGVNQAEVELRVGPGTFKPMEHECVEDHPIHHEWCHCPQATIDAINHTRAEGGRVIAVGTTVVRTLESAWESGTPAPSPAGRRALSLPAANHPRLRFSAHQFPPAEIDAACHGIVPGGAGGTARPLSLRHRAGLSPV